MRRCFEKSRAPKDFDIKQKKLFWKKKNRGSSRVEGSGLQLGVIPYFFDPWEIPFFVRYFKPMLTPKQAKDLEKIEIRKKIFKSSGFRNSKTLNSY